MKNQKNKKKESPRSNAVEINILTIIFKKETNAGGTTAPAAKNKIMDTNHGLNATRATAIDELLKNKNVVSIGLLNNNIVNYTMKDRQGQSALYGYPDGEEEETLTRTQAKARARDLKSKS